MKLLLALSPRDNLIHAAACNVYTTSGEPAITLCCEGVANCKMTRRRYEIRGQSVTCLTCLVVSRGGP